MLKYLKALPYYDIVPYIRASDVKGCIPFTGTPKKHPYDTEKVVLITQPLSTKATFYEFNLKDIEYVESLPSIAAENGENVKIVKIWVKKGSFGIRYEPFTVDEPIHFFHN
jgi:inorganic pyrophosphatase